MFKKRIVPIAVLAASFLLGMIASANAQYPGSTCTNVPVRYVSAEHAVVGAKSEYVLDIADRSKRDVYRQFSRSRNFAEIVLSHRRVRNKSAYLLSMAQQGSCLRQIRREAVMLDRCVQELEDEIVLARLRADRGLDYPLNGCTLHFDRKLARISEAVQCMLEELEDLALTRQRFDTHSDWHRRSQSATRSAHSYYRSPRSSYRVAPAENYFQVGGNRGISVRIGTDGNVRFGYNR